jgi:glycine dehydrogenase subunit 2
MIRIKGDAEMRPETVLNAPLTMPVKRLDDVRAARQLDVKYTA